MEKKQPFKSFQAFAFLFNSLILVYTLSIFELRINLKWNPILMLHKKFRDGIYLTATKEIQIAKVSELNWQIISNQMFSSISVNCLNVLFHVCNKIALTFK